MPPGQNQPNAGGIGLILARLWYIMVCLQGYFSLSRHAFLSLTTWATQRWGLVTGSNWSASLAGPSRSTMTRWNVWRWENCLVSDCKVSAGVELEILSLTSNHPHLKWNIKKLFVVLTLNLVDTFIKGLIWSGSIFYLFLNKVPSKRRCYLYIYR